MTSETSRIQSLINEIDEVLSKTTPRLPWVMSSEAAQQRQVLEQTRSYLLSSLSALQEAAQEAAPPQAIEARQPTDQGVINQGVTNQGVMAAVNTPFPSANAMESSAQQVLQAVLQEMNYLRTNMLQPMRSDVDALRMQRDALMQEVRQLEAQRQQYQLSQDPQYITEFLQAAMAKVQENLSSQMTQMLATFAAQSPDQARLGAAPSGLGLPGTADLSTLSPTERLAYMQRIQAQSDQLMMRLDSTLRVIFESLQSNVNSYRDSLGEGLDRMHDMGQQGEAVFGAFVTRLAQIMGREASSFLQQQSSSDWKGDRPSLPGRGLAVETDPDFQIDRLLEELSALDQTAPNQPETGMSLPFDHNMAAPESLPVEMELENLELLDRELSQLDLTDNPTEVDLPADAVTFLPNEPFSFPSFEDSENQTNTTLNVEPSRVDLDVAEEELESALDLLNQITPDVEETPINQSGAVSEPPLVSQPEQLYEDEFYRSLFGQPPVEPASQEASQISESVPSEAVAEPPTPSSSVGSAADDKLEGFVAEYVNADRTSEEVSFDLFAGLVDPALEVTPAPEIPVFDLTASLPQSGESLLFQTPEPPAPNIEEDFDSFFVGEDEPVAVTPDRDGVETIASLLDLIPQADRELESSAIQPAPTPAEEGYELAQPGEDLLALDSPLNPVTLPNVELPSDTLQQLTTDLANLESPHSSTPPSETAGWTLADWDEALTPEPQNPSPEPTPTELTIEDLLFGDGLAESTPDAASGDIASENITRPDRTPDAASKLETANDLMQSTIEDWFASVESNPVVTPEPKQESDLFDWEGNSSTPESEVEENTFTLEGLGNLFEGVPSIEPTPTPDQPAESESPAITLEDAFGEFDPAPEPSAESSESKKKG